MDHHTHVDSFGVASSRYAACRPVYPDALFAWLAEQCRVHDSAWDVATGNGQAAHGLVPFFKQVWATDVSASQISNALPHDSIRYERRSAEESGFPEASFDLIAVAQALHWFDFDVFWTEVRRVARPGALFGAWCYDWPACSEEIESLLLQPFRDLVHPFWSERNAVGWRGYVDEDIAFPFERLGTPALSIQASWTLGHLIDYLHTWSAAKLADAKTKAWMAQLVEDILQRIGAKTVIPVRMPLKMVAGYVT